MSLFSFIRDGFVNNEVVDGFKTTGNCYTFFYSIQIQGGPVGIVDSLWVDHDSIGPSVFPASANYAGLRWITPGMNLLVRDSVVNTAGFLSALKWAPATAAMAFIARGDVFIDNSQCAYVATAYSFTTAAAAMPSLHVNNAIPFANNGAISGC
jgi:hypothetical protein